LAAARTKADAVVAAVKKGGNFNEAVVAQGLAPAQPIAGRRIDVTQQQAVPPVVSAFLNTPPGSVKVLPSDQGWVLVHTESVTKGDVAAIPGLVEAGRREIAGQVPEEFASAFAAAAERELGTTRNPDTIKAITRRLSGLDSGQ
jgi:peptidyl-prolyl cis-trans isomerase D